VHAVFLVDDCVEADGVVGGAGIEKVALAVEDARLRELKIE